MCVIIVCTVARPCTPNWPAGRPGQPIPALGRHGDDAGEAARGRRGSTGRRFSATRRSLVPACASVELAHQDNTNASPEEADEVARLVDIFAGCLWRDQDDAVERIGCDGILIVTPYNAQIRAIQSALAARGLTGFRVGTVDKFQGREAPIVLY